MAKIKLRPILPRIAPDIAETEFAIFLRLWERMSIPANGIAWAFAETEFAIHFLKMQLPAPRIVFAETTSAVRERMQLPARKIVFAETGSAVQERMQIPAPRIVFAKMGSAVQERM